MLANWTLRLVLYQNYPPLQRSLWVVVWFKDQGICKSHMNYSIVYPKPQNKRVLFTVHECQCSLDQVRTSLCASVYFSLLRLGFVMCPNLVLQYISLHVCNYWSQANVITEHVYMYTSFQPHQRSSVGSELAMRGSFNLIKVVGLCFKPASCDLVLLPGKVVMGQSCLWLGMACYCFIVTWLSCWSPYTILLVPSDCFACHMTCLSYVTWLPCLCHMTCLSYVTWLASAMSHDYLYSCYLTATLYNYSCVLLSFLTCVLRYI